MAVKAPIPNFDLKFVKTTDKYECPKCGSKEYFDTGFLADNDLQPIESPQDLPSHPIYRCKSCAQLFRMYKPDRIVKKFPTVEK